MFHELEKYKIALNSVSYSTVLIPLTGRMFHELRKIVLQAGEKESKVLIPLTGRMFHEFNRILSNV